jgi:hypothetical protein
VVDSVALCPVSTVGGATEMTGATSAGFTVTDTVGEEVAVAGGVAPEVVPVSVNTT